jgi:hypothetical protein
VFDDDDDDGDDDAHLVQTGTAASLDFCLGFIGFYLVSCMLVIFS